MNFNKKYLKYKKKYIKLKNQIGGGSGKDIIDLLNEIIRIYDSSGTHGVEEFLQTKDISLHQDSTNTSSIEENIENIRTIISMFNEKYVGKLEEGYTDFDDYAIGGYVCLDAKVSILTDFLINDHPFKSGNPKEQVLGLQLSKLITNLCNDLQSENDFDKYKRVRNIENVKVNLKAIFNKYIPKYVTSAEIDSFVEMHIIDYVNELENKILDCDGKFNRLKEIEESKIDVKKDISYLASVSVLKKNTILLGENDIILGILSFDQHFPNLQHGFNTNSGYILKSNIKNIIVKE